ESENSHRMARIVWEHLGLFPCPDLLPVVLSDKFVQTERDNLPELPVAKQARFIKDHGLSAYDASVLTQDRLTANYFEIVAKACGDSKLAANWVSVELAALLNKHDLGIADCPISADNLAQLIQRIKDSTISGKIAKTVFEAMWAGEGTPDEIIDARGLKQVSDSGAIEAMVDEVLAANAQQVDNYRKASPDKQPKMLGFFVGQVMKISKGQANPGEVNRILKEKI
ncbi:MAG: Asp-tRNA(Asn)/Glu-tRNA(Gln) amidotransferase GatCAB subunit B, partial [Pseudomonadales bacterium]